MTVEMPATMPILHSDSVTLRGFDDSDVDVVREAAADSLIPLISTVPTAADDAAVLAYIHRQRGRLTERQGFSFAIAERESGRAVGQIGLWLRNIDLGRASVGYWIVASARRRGFAKMALMTLSEWGLTLPGIHRLELCVEPWNEVSWRAAEHAGYQREGLLRSWEVVGKDRRDMFIYSQLPSPNAATNAGVDLADTRIGYRR